MSLERKIESSIFLCIPRDLNILGKSCTAFVIVKIVPNLSRGRSPCQRVNHVKSGVIYFSAFIYSCIWYYSYVEPGPNKGNIPTPRVPTKSPTILESFAFSTK